MGLYYNSSVKYKVYIWLFSYLGKEDYIFFSVKKAIPWILMLIFFLSAIFLYVFAAKCLYYYRK